MSIKYNTTTNFGAKDALPPKDPNKIIYGAAFTTEFDNITAAFAEAAPTSNPTFTGNANFDSITANTITTDTITTDGVTTSGDVNVTGDITASGDVDVAGDITAPNFKGVASSATELETARNINGTAFDGTAGITTSKWGTARNISIGGTSKSVDGSGNYTWTTAEIGITKANIDALNIEASQLNNTFTVQGTDFDGSANKTVTFTGSTGISVSGTAITNTAPDKVVKFTNGNGISVTGTYPNFTITNSKPNVAYTLPLAASGTRGGAKIGYAASGKNYPVKLSSEKMYVNVPWSNTTYTAANGVKLTGTKFEMSGSYTGNLTLTGELRVAKASSGSYAVSIGANSGKTNQGEASVALGFNCGETNQDYYSVSVGANSGTTSQGANAVAIGRTCGNENQGNSTVAIGNAAGSTGQGIYGVAIGRNAGMTSQGDRSVAIGNLSGKVNQGANGIIISSDDSQTNSTTVGHIIIKSSTHDLKSIPNGGFAMSRDPIIGTRSLINTLSTLRKATMDETTLEGLRDSIGNAIGGLIEKFEAEIAAMPAPEVDTDTMDIKQ